MVEVSLTVGKLDASLAVLLTKDHHLIEFPTILLPNGVKGGSIVKIKCEHDLETELEEKRRFQSIQDEIFTMFGKNVPKSPVLGIKNVTQTSCVLQWEPLDLGTASFKSLTLYRDDAKLFSVPNPLSNRTTKLSGLAIDKEFKFQLRLDTTAGVFSSDIVTVRTHKMTDLSGINVCIQDIAPNEYFTIDDINVALKKMGAHSPAHDKMKVDTTHYITTRENKENPEFLKANEMNVPIIRPEWLKACERERRIVGVLNFYVKDCALPTIFAENYWADSEKQRKSTVQATKAVETANVDKSSPLEGSNIPSVQITELSDNEESKPAPLEKDVVEEQAVVENEPVADEEKEENIEDKKKDTEETKEVEKTEESKEVEETEKTKNVEEKGLEEVELNEATEVEILSSLGADVNNQEISTNDFEEDLGVEKDAKVVSSEDLAKSELNGTGVSEDVTEPQKTTQALDESKEKDEELEEKTEKILDTVDQEQKDEKDDLEVVDLNS